MTTDPTPDPTTTPTPTLPTMAEVLSSATARYSPAVLDRALAAHDAQVAAKALRDAAVDPELVGLRYGTPKWLNARADAVAAAAPDERERAQRYTTVLAHLNREQARAEAAEAEVDALRARIELLAREYDDAIPGFVRRLRAALAARPVPTVNAADVDEREALVDAVVDRMRRAYSRPGDPMEPARLRRQAEEVVDLLAARPARGERATDPLIVSAIRRHPNGTLRYEPANGPATGTSGRSFLAEYDAALAARPAPVVSEEQVRAMRSRIAALVNPTGDPNPAWDIAVASIIHEVLAALGLTVADEGRAEA